MHNGNNAQIRRGPSGDHARRRPFWRLWVLRRSPFWRLWVLRLPLQRARGPAATTRAASPSAVSGHCIALQIPMAVTHRTAGGPAATARAAVPSGGSGYCACHCRSEGPSGDHARRRPFCSLWTLHCFANRNGSNTQNRRGPSGDHARRRPFCSLWTLHCFANPNGSNAQNCRGPSGDHARRSPFWRLWVLRLPLQRARGPAATTRAAGPSAVSGHCIALQITMAVTHRTAGGPAATTRAAVPSGGSGYCACHCRERGAQQRPRAPQALLQSLDTALLCKSQWH